MPGSVLAGIHIKYTRKRNKDHENGEYGDMNATLGRIYEVCPVFLQNFILTGYSAMLDKDRYGGRYHEYRELLLKTQYYSRQELMSYQDEKLKELIQHAYATVPYYRNIFHERGLIPSDIKTQEDIYKLPLLTKEQIKKNFKSLISDKYNSRELKYGHTSGTTGSPLEVCYDPAVIYITYAALDRQYQWAGCRLASDGDRIAVARGNVIVPLSQRKPPFWRYNRFHNQILLSSFHFSNDNLPLYFEELRRYNPVVLDGYPSTLYILAKFLKNKGQTYPLKAVISSSETLYDFQREVIEESFQCKIFDYYALAERVVFATECEEHHGHHLCMEYGISEIIDDADAPATKGKVGRLVGTSLHNFGMPMIRYVTNDKTAIKTEPCPCGRSLDMMEDVATKAEDILTLKDGRYISPSVLTHPFKPLNSIQESQIIQKDYDRIIINIVPGKDYAQSDTQHLVSEFKKRLGDDVSVTVQIMEAIPKSERGKFRWVISEIPLQ